MIYFLQGTHRDGGKLIKIGTTIRLAVRVNSPDIRRFAPLEVLGITDGSYADEAAIHRKFDNCRWQGEWFRDEPEIRAFIAAEARPWTPDEDAPTPPMSAVRIDAEIVNSARIIAVADGKTLAEYLAEIVQPILDRDLAELGRKLVGSSESV